MELDSLMPICLDGKDIEYTDSVRYLGVLIVSNRGFCVSAKDDIRFFYRASNSILAFPFVFSISYLKTVIAPFVIRHIVISRQFTFSLD